MIEYPVVGNSPAGKVSYKAARVMLMPESWWFTLEPAANGVYSASALSNLDSIITAHRTNGAAVLMGLYGTPTGYAQTAANPNFGDNVTLGPSNSLGENSFPNSLAAVTNVVTMLINRYNKAGGAWYDAHFAALGKGIQYWETWNEPAMDALGNTATSSGQRITNRGWWGTPAQMIDVAYTEYAAIKAADPSVTVTSPAIPDNTGPAGILRTFLITAGAANPTKTGAMACDAVAYHPYFAGPPGVYFGAWQTPFLGNIVSGTLGVATFANWLQTNGYNLPLHITEWGFDTSSATGTVATWYAQTPEFRYNWIARTFMCAAACGAKSIHPWHWGETSDASGNSGNWQGDTTGVQKAYNDIAAKVSGKTIVGGFYVMNGRVTLYFSDGTAFSV